MCLNTANSQEHKRGEKSFLDSGASYAHVYNVIMMAWKKKKHWKRHLKSGHPAQIWNFFF